MFFCKAGKVFAKARKFFTKARKISAKFDAFRSRLYVLEPMFDVNSFLQVKPDGIHNFFTFGFDLQNRDHVKLRLKLPCADAIKL